MPKIVGKATRVVEVPGELSIDELVGNVASNEDNISIAHVNISAPCGEPWLNLHYDEWMCVLKGRMLLHHAEGVLEVVAGQTVFIGKGERFRPEFPDAGTEYIPVCLPAFSPDRCIREDDPSGEVVQKLAELHTKPVAATASASLATTEDPEPDTLYHMCQVSVWEEAKREGSAYFPPTFEQDGFTHATGVPSRLITTANHFYQSIGGPWVCLRFSRTALKKLGIIVKYEQPMAVGAQSPDTEEWTTWVCPHVYGGIPPQVVEAELPMVRDGAVFKSIEGV